MFATEVAAKHGHYISNATHSSGSLVVFEIIRQRDALFSSLGYFTVPPNGRMDDKR
jgi:hypothetical protein